MNDALQKTVLHAVQRAGGATMAPFAGYEMPLHFGSALKEHHAVRSACGVFDCSHMGIIEVMGPGAQALLRRAMANDIARLKGPGRAQYTLMLHEGGGILDDLIVSWLGEDRYRLVVNAATKASDLAHLQVLTAGEPVQLVPRPDWALLAVQGPRAEAMLGTVLPDVAPQLAAMRSFAVWEGLQGTPRQDWMLSRTGYTGEDGFEVVLPGDQAAALWTQLLEAGVAPCGLAARDSLRLEAGLNLYGIDMDRDTTPEEVGLGWTVAHEPFERSFVGRQALQEHVNRFRRVGLVLQDRGVLRAGQALWQHDGQVGVVTSGGHSPTMGCGIALARLDLACADTGHLQVAIRERLHPVAVVEPPFVRRGRIMVDVPSAHGAKSTG
jgi:aminomethyltransferase